VLGDSDLFVEEGNAITIHPAYEGKIIQYRWSPSSYLNTINLPYTTAMPPDDIIYTLRATGEGNCITTKFFYIDVIQLLKIPNAFSPNNDGINDSWQIGNIYKYPQASVEIFNRYGQRVFFTLKATVLHGMENIKASLYPLALIIILSIQKINTCRCKLEM